MTGESLAPRDQVQLSGNKQLRMQTDDEYSMSGGITDM